MNIIKQLIGILLAKKMYFSIRSEYEKYENKFHLIKKKKKMEEGF